MANTSRLLFVGNSFTFRNDLPGLIAQMAPVPIETQMIVSGGASLRQHINSGAVQAALESASWDWVVLQEQSTLPIKSPARFADSVREMHALITAHGAQTALYQTWARKNAPETQNVLSSEYAKLATELGARLVPVGAAWQGVLHEKPDAPLYDTDGSHPSPVGSYLAACVFVAALWAKNPSGAPVPDALKMKSEDATLLQKAAWRAAKS